MMYAISITQVDLSILERATGARPLPMDRLMAQFSNRTDEDDASMVVEVDSSAGDLEASANEQSQSGAAEDVSPFKQPAQPPMRVMHRSWCQNDDVSLRYLSNITLLHMITDCNACSVAVGYHRLN